MCRKAALAAFIRAAPRRGYLPLEVPNRLLRALTAAYAAGSDRTNITVGKEQEGVWIALDNPDQLTEGDRQEALHLKKELEHDLRDANEKARPDFQALFQRQRQRPRSAAELIRHYCENESFVYDIVNPIYKSIAGADLPRTRVRQFLRDIPGWPLYLLGWALSVYQRTIRSAGYGWRKNPGTLDLWCTIYLPYCDCFVTGDAGQRRALRILNLFNASGTRIISYNGLRARLVLA